METFARDLRYAVRTLLHMRGVAIVAILTLALGIGATTTMFSVVLRDAAAAGAVRRPRSPGDPVQHQRDARATDCSGCGGRCPDTDELERVATSFDSFGSFSGPLLTLSGGGEPEHVDGETVPRGYFQALRVTPVAGRVFTAEESTAAGAHPVALIGERLWKRRFNGRSGHPRRHVTVNDVPLTIVGILPERFTGMSGKAELWIAPPMAARLYYAEYLTSPQHFISVVARMKVGVSLTQANAELAAIGPQFVGNARRPAPVERERGAAADARVDPTVRQSALVLLAAAVCVLLIACVNVAGLLLARARMRRREIAIRLAIGSGRARLVRQLLAEGLLIAPLAGVCGTLLAWWGVTAVDANAPGIGPAFGNDYNAVRIAFGGESRSARADVRHGGNEKAHVHANRGSGP